MKKKKHEEHENMERWLVSYADFITLLFAFFVVMYSTSSSISGGKLRAVSDSISASLNPILSFSDSKIGAAGSKAEAEMFDVGIKLYTRLEKTVKKSGNSGKISVTEDQRGIIVRISDDLFFSPGSTEMLPGFHQALDEITTLIEQIPNPIQVEGHTDNVPVKGSIYPSNWELSTARAASVVRHLVEHHLLDPWRFSVAGYGEYRPITTNDTPDRRTKNRRVEIVILNMPDTQKSTAAEQAPVLDTRNQDALLPEDFPRPAEVKPNKGLDQPIPPHFPVTDQSG